MVYRNSWDALDSTKSDAARRAAAELRREIKDRLRYHVLLWSIVAVLVALTGRKVGLW